MSMSGYGTMNNASPIYIGNADAWGVGNGNGTLNITGGNLTINAYKLSVGGIGSTAALNATIDGTGFSTINVSSGTTIGTGSTFSLTLGTGFSATVGQVFTIINGSAITGAFTGLAEGGTLTGGGYTFSASYLGNAFTLTTVPEPATWALLAGSLTTLVVFRRRRQA
jgi:hypothetical protein